MSFLLNLRYQFCLSIFSCSLILVVGGIVMVWPSPLTKWFSSKDSEIYLTEEEVSWLVSIGPIGAVIGAIPTGILSDKYGRKPVLMSTAVLMTLCWGLILFTRQKWSLFLSQTVAGTLTGGMASVAPVYLSEISPPEIRGAVVGQMVTMFNLGQVIVYSLGPVLSYTHYLLVCFSIPTIFLISFLFSPETPYFLLSKGKRREAELILLKLGGSEAILELDKSKEEVKESVSKEERSMWDVLKQPPHAKNLVYILILSGVGQANGFAILSLYGEELVDGGWVILVMSLILTVTTFFSSMLLDRIGRKPLILFSMAGSGVFTLLLAAYFYFWNKWLLYTGVFGFSVIQSIGNLSTLASELFPTKLRALANGLNQLISALAASASVKLFLPVKHAWGVQANFFIATFASILGAGVMLLLPETAKTRISD